MEDFSLSPSELYTKFQRLHVFMHGARVNDKKVKLLVHAMKEL